MSPRTRASTPCATRSTCVEDKQFTRDYHDPDKRSIANALTVDSRMAARSTKSWSNIRSATSAAAQEGIPLLLEKFRTNLARRFPEKQQHAIAELSLDRARLEQTPVNEYVDLYVI